MSDFARSAVDIEEELLAEVSVDRGWRLIERFSGLVRESGTDDERAAAEHIVSELDEMGIPHRVHEPELYLSRPVSARVETGGGPALEAKPSSFSASTPEAGVAAELVHVPASGTEGIADLFDDHHPEAGDSLEGKIVVTGGFGMPGEVRRFEEAGAVGQVYVNPGENIHWGICTPVWGTPTDRDLERIPSTPVVAVSRPDGEALVDRIADGDGVHARLHARLEEGWERCPLPVAEIRGRREEFLLVHGHYDSWDVGIGDNAVGDATLLELARIFGAHRDRLERSLRVAWWPGHSTGRYAGSAWYADRHAMELRKRCVAAVNVDSPGCWKATEYDDVMWMAEAAGLGCAAIEDATGKEAGGRRPVRAGDYSFDQVGLSSFFMLLSNIPAEERARLGFYPVGGCGGNIAWHTEDDTLEVADRENLERDLRVYVTALARVLNAGVLPLDFRATAAELRDALEDYRDAAGDPLDPALAELDVLEEELRWLYGTVEDSGESTAAGSGSPPDPDAINRTLRELSRTLVPLLHAEGDRFHHDPALPRAPVPRLADAARLPEVEKSDPGTARFLRTRLRREANHVANRLHEAAEEIRGLRGD